MIKDATINHWMQQSCDAWNSNRATRIIYRQAFWIAGEVYFRSKEHQNLIHLKNSGAYNLNTYLWPYCSKNCGNWEEDNTEGHYTLVPDPSGFIIRHPTSYCACMIRETTGHWPKRKTPRGEKLFHAKCWQEFLAEAGYETIAVMPLPKHRYVGIEEHSETEFGEVVWFEKYGSVGIDDSGAGKVTISTYRDKEHFVGAVDPQKYLWVQII